jgi:hypothetical protein
MTRTQALYMLIPVAAISFVMVSSCEQTDPVALPADVSVVATVNGVPITDLDVQFETQGSGGHGAEQVPADEKQVLDTVILREIARQKAVESGFDIDTDFQNERYHLQAQVAAFERKRLSEIYYAREQSRAAEVSDAEARKFFEQNRDIIGQEIRMWQILRRDKDLIAEDLDELLAGEPFERVAGKRFPELPQLDRKPWDLGYMNWQQIPQPWWEAIKSLNAGETSGIIQGPNERYWIIRVIDQRAVATFDFESALPRIKELLSSEKTRQFRVDIEQDLLDDSRIVYTGQ